MAETERKSAQEQEGQARTPAQSPDDRAAPGSRPGEQGGGQAQPIPPELPILPLKGTVIFPLTVVPLAAGQGPSLRLIDDAVNGDRLIGFVMQKDGEQAGDAIKPGDTHEIGTMGMIHQ